MWMGRVVLKDGPDSLSPSPCPRGVWLRGRGLEPTFLTWSGESSVCPFASLLQAAFPSLCFWPGSGPRCVLPAHPDMPYPLHIVREDPREDLCSSLSQGSLCFSAEQGARGQLTSRPELLLVKLLETHLNFHPATRLRGVSRSWNQGKGQS